MEWFALLILPSRSSQMKWNASSAVTRRLCAFLIACIPTDRSWIRARAISRAVCLVSRPCGKCLRWNTTGLK